MNKTNIAALESPLCGEAKLSPQLQVDFADVEVLGDFWNSRRLPGFHWRLYHHSTRGAGVVLKGGRKLELLPDRLYLLPPAEDMGSYVDRGGQEQTFIHFALEGCFLNSHGDPYEVKLDDGLNALLGKLRGELKEHGTTPVSQLYANAIVAIALTHCRDALESALTDPRISAACRLMKESPAHPWSNPEFARRFGFAPNAFIRKFREVVGIAPHKYLQCIRYSLAARLLETTDLGIAEIAGRVGINDKFHFSREFKRIHERSPSAHRRKMTASNRLHPTPSAV
ncbi:MAG: AraC family transcriptional regulator [Lentisphaeria bacterium]